MSYTPTTWHGGDVLSAEAMNKIEQGIANSGGAFIVEYDNDNGVLNKTYNEIQTAFLNGLTVIIYGPTSEIYEICFSLGFSENNFYIISTWNYSFYAGSINDYPSPINPNAPEVS